MDSPAIDLEYFQSSPVRTRQASSDEDIFQSSLSPLPSLQELQEGIEEGPDLEESRTNREEPDDPPRPRTPQSGPAHHTRGVGERRPIQKKRKIVREG